MRYCVAIAEADIDFTWTKIEKIYIIVKVFRTLLREFFSNYRSLLLFLSDLLIHLVTKIKHENVVNLREILYSREANMISLLYLSINLLS